MIQKRFWRAAALAGLVAILLAPERAAAQATGSVEFVARVEATGGQPEPVRQLTFYLLRKSVEDIRKEAEQSAPGMDLDKFIDGLNVSPELKAWMRKHHSVRLNGAEFLKSVTADDIVDIPEFFKAYMAHNEAYRGLGFPEPKFREKDQKSNPEKYQEQKKQYEDAVRKFIGANMDTVQGMDLEMVELDPWGRWSSMQQRERQGVDTRAFQLAEQRYVVARTQTDLDGRGSFAGIAPGAYWIGLFGAEAISGDVHLRWDLPVTVRPGQTAGVELSNVNAARPTSAALNPDN